MKKKLYIGILCITFLLVLGCSSVYADEVIGEVYGSDTAAYIDGHQIPVYVYQGYPYVVAEDLNGYGFDVRWDAYTDILDIQYNPAKGLAPYGSVGLDFLGGKLADVYSTQTRVRVGSDFVPAYSLGGRMLVSLDELWRYGSVNWYPESLTISFTSREFMAMNPDWEVLMPAHVMLYNVYRACCIEADRRLASDVNYPIPLYGPYGWDYYNTVIHVNPERMKYLNIIKAYLQDRLTCIENNNTFYYKGNFYHYIYAAIMEIEYNISNWNLLNGHSQAFYHNNYEKADTGFYEKLNELHNYIYPYQNLQKERTGITQSQ